MDRFLVLFMMQAVAYAIKRCDVDMPSAKRDEGGGWKDGTPTQTCVRFEHEIAEDNGEMLQMAHTRSGQNTSPI